MRAWAMFPPQGGTILCAVSGGRDSVCLLHYLHSLGENEGFTVAAGHYNHHMRPTAQRDEDFVRKLAADLGVAFYTDGLPVVETAREQGLGVEEMGRNLRYEFLERTARKIGAERIATAHHQGDQAETVLLNLLRGTGPEGLRGIPPVRGNLIRPLLNTPRSEIEAYLKEHHLGCVEDETNNSPAFTRNRLRQQVLPQLETINPAWQQNIARTAAIIGREDRYLDELAGQQLSTAMLETAALRDAPEALRPRMVRLLLDRWGLGRKDITAAHIAAILALAESPKDGSVSLPGGSVIARRGRLLWQPLAARPQSVPLREGENHWGAWTITVHRGTIPTPGETLHLRCNFETQTVTAAPCRLAERLTLPGSRGGRTLKRLFTERSVPAEMRSTIPAIRIDDRLAAVPGLGIDQNFLPQSGEDTITLSINKHDELEDTQWQRAIWTRTF